MPISVPSQPLPRALAVLLLCTSKSAAFHRRGRKPKRDSGEMGVGEAGCRERKERIQRDKKLRPHFLSIEV